MKKIMIAALGLSFLSGTGMLFAQNTSTDTSSTMKSTKKSKKHKKSTATDTTSTSPSK